MNNKRGISQAFSMPPRGIALRRATVHDVFDMSRVLTTSIRELCAADHDGDPDTIANWTANKTPQALRSWFHGEQRIWLALLDGQTEGVGSVAPDGRITVLYVAPRAVGQGVGAALLAGLERDLAHLGCRTGRLTATATAREFYLARGWVEAGEPDDGNYVRGYPMRKSLQPQD